VASPNVPVENHNTHIIADFSTSRRLTRNVVRALGYFHPMTVACVVDVSEEHAASFFRVEVSRVSECCVVLCRLAVQQVDGPL
jgi:hypothetical protein